MAIKYQKKLKDRKNRSNFLKNEKIKRYYKFMRLKYQNLLNIKSESIKAIKILRNFQQKMQNLPKVKLNNYCVLTGRDKGVYRDFKLSRHQIKSHFTMLTGLRNSSF